MAQHGDPRQREQTNGPAADALRAFGLIGEVETLPGGTRHVYRVGEVVLKPIRDTSLENNGSRDLVQWIADLFVTLPQIGFRVPQPRRTAMGGWLTADGWTAWSFLEGRHAVAGDIPPCVEAISAFHRALVGVPTHPLLDASRTPWAVAHRACLGEPPAQIHPAVRGLVEQLYALRRPVDGLSEQVIHGDLNPENLLVAPGQPIGLLDMSPFWGPPELALAIFANWIGPRQGDAGVLSQFAGVRHFDQVLIRAGIRMLLVMSESGDLSDWETCSERRAAEIIIAWVERGRSAASARGGDSEAGQSRYRGRPLNNGVTERGRKKDLKA